MKHVWYGHFHLCRSFSKDSIGQYSCLSLCLCPWFGLSLIRDCVLCCRHCCSVQDFFVRTANQRKGMLASTHLVLRTPDGTKYQAAQKWGLPAITLRWILESARLGRKADEQRFLVDLPPSPGQSSSSNYPTLEYSADWQSTVYAVLLNLSCLLLLLPITNNSECSYCWKKQTHTFELTECIFIIEAWVASISHEHNGVILWIFRPYLYENILRYYIQIRIVCGIPLWRKTGCLTALVLLLAWKIVYMITLWNVNFCCLVL